MSSGLLLSRGDRRIGAAVPAGSIQRSKCLGLHVRALIWRHFVFARLVRFVRLVVSRASLRIASVCFCITHTIVPRVMNADNVQLGAMAPAAALTAAVQVSLRI